ncbi:SWIM zinc finger domain-containing protein [Cupriavidus sp. NPDC089707]|uniref:SWIM zinc finger family protein n=1 Tax=Cupriavidus sp. NPDC089707 TaxID=3363963 RepID=UPI003812301B
MSAPAELAEILTLAEVLAQTDARTFERGKAYFHEGVVSRLEEREGAVRASVRGTHRYRVELAVAGDGALAYACSCPVGDQGIFCKHAVAVSLAWLENSGEEVFHADETTQGKPRKKRKTYGDVIREYVATLDKDALQELLLEAVELDRTLRDKLLFAARSAQATDLPGMRTAVRQFTRISRPLDWTEADEYGNGLWSLAEMLRQRLAGPHAAQVVELAELAIAGAEESLEQIDDSSGGVMPGIVELASVHLDACKQTRPDPVKLAERLFRLQTEGQWDTFYDVLPAYAEPLGKSGLRRYRQLVSEAWEALAPLPPGNERGPSFQPHRLTLENAMRALAELDGDIDALIQICAKDLSSPYRFLQVAELCVKHGRPDEGLAWAEKGLRKSGSNADSRLLDFCIDAYLHRGESEQASTFAWRRFEMHPTADTFPALMKVATAVGLHDETRERALKLFWALVKEEESTAKSKRKSWQTPTRSELVKLFLSEKMDDLAWDAFVGGAVATQLWPRMAAARGKTHPRDAITLYQRLLPVAVQSGAGSARYDEAFEIVRAIENLRAKLGERAEFSRELEEIRATYRAKRNFIKLLATLS